MVHAVHALRESSTQYMIHRRAGEGSIYINYYLAAR